MLNYRRVQEVPSIIKHLMIYPLVASKIPSMFTPYKLMSTINIHKP